jgi:hypothetical protein
MKLFYLVSVSPKEYAHTKKSAQKFTQFTGKGKETFPIINLYPMCYNTGETSTCYCDFIIQVIDMKLFYLVSG